MMKNRMGKRLLSGALALAMVLGYVPVPTFAGEAEGLCEHHPVHTADCGYAPAVEGQDCTHAHSEECYDTVTECVHIHGDCGYAEAVEGHGCDCEADENGNLVHTEGCGFVEAVEGASCDHVCSQDSGCITRALNCRHLHDEACGYVEPREASPCAFVCATCSEEPTEPSSPEEPETPTEPEEPTEPEVTEAPTEPEEPTEPTESGEDSIEMFVEAPMEEAEAQEVFGAFLSSLFFGDGSASYGTAAGRRLTGADKFVYDALRPEILKIAQGTQTSTVISVSMGGYSFGDLNFHLVMNALYFDLPFEMFWYYGCGLTGSYVGGQLMLKFLFVPAANYQPADYDADNPTIDLTEVRRAVKAADNAKAIAERFAALDDYEKLCAFADEICYLVEYDYDAAEKGTYNLNINPWTLVNVFDNDFSTKVVCEGYAEAFQYLCDLSTFRGDVEVYCATSIDHKWNIVHIEGQNYLMDVTHCDYGTSAYRGPKFLGGGSGSIDAGYVIGGFHYAYDAMSLSVYGTGEDSILKLAPTKYVPGASEPDTPESFYTLKDGVLTIRISGDMEDYTYPLDSNPAPWYDRWEEITSVVIEEGVTSIGSNAFYGCKNLASVSIPGSVSAIHSSAFWGCYGLTQLSLPVGLTDIGYSAFYGCKGLTELTIPNGVTSIGSYAFQCCFALTTVTIPGSITSIGHSAFESCRSLTSVAIPEGVTAILANTFSGCTSLAEVSLPRGLTTIQNAAFRECALTSIVIPEGVTSIGEYAFKDCQGLRAATIPGSVSTIGWGAFDGCTGLTELTLSEGITTIGPYAFRNCTSLPAVTIPESVTTIRNDAFWGCTGLTDITIPQGVSSIGEYAFGDCTSLTFIRFLGDGISGVNVFNTPVTAYYPSGNPTWTEEIRAGFGSTVTWVEACTNGMAHTEVIDPRKEPTCTETGLTEGNHCSVCGEVLVAQNTIPAKGHSFRDGRCESCGAFGGACGKNGSNLTWAFSDGTLTISGTGEMADYTSDYYGGNPAPWYYRRYYITNVILQEGVTSIGSTAFYDFRELTTVTLPESLTAIGEYAFWDCKKLPGIAIPEGVASIAGHAFYCCTGLTKITLPESLTSIGKAAFYGCQSLTGIAIPEGITSVGSSAFASCSSLATVTLPQSLTSIGNSAFTGCSSLTSISIPIGVTAIGNGAFHGCTRLTKIAIPQGVTAIGDYTFQDCTSLTEVTLPQSLTSIGKDAFLSCSSLSGIAIPEGVTSIGSRAFSYCSSLTKITIPQGVTSIEFATFSDCENLTEITILENVTSIGRSAFSRCSSLSGITIPQSVTSIGSYAFSECSNLANITIPRGVTSIGEFAFEDCTSLTSIRFLGDGIHGENVCNTPVTAYYPRGNATWTEEIRAGFGSTVIWVEACTNGMDHTEVIDSAKEATCTETGLTEGKHCSVCDVVLVAQEIIPAKGHTEVIDPGKAPTCTEEGLTEGKHCSVCRDVLVAQEPIPALGHAEITDPGKEATCTEDGLTEGKHCSVCGEVLVAQEVVPALGHSFQDGACTRCGLLGGTCGEELSYTIVEGVLTITGTGAIPDFREDAPAPWYDHRSEITNLVLSEGLTTIGGSAFRGCTGLLSAVIPESVTAIAPQAFHDCEKLLSVRFLGDGISGEDVFNTPVTAYYPEHNPTWTEEILASFGSFVTWAQLSRAPRLVSTTLTLNSNLISGVDAGLREYNFNTIQGVTLYEYSASGKTYADEPSARFLVEDGKLRTTEQVKNGTYKLKMDVTCRDEETYSYFLQVKVANSLPSVTVKQTGKFNLFYLDSTAGLTVTAPGQNIDQVVLTDTGDFTLADGTTTLCYTENPAAKPDTKAALEVWLEGYQVPVKKAITISTVTTAPKLSFRPASTAFNTALNNRSTTLRVYNNTQGAYLDLTDATVRSSSSFVTVGVENGDLTLTLNGTKGGTATIYIQDPDWTQSVKLTHKVSVSTKAPTLKLGTTAVTLNTQLDTQQSREIPVTLSQSNISMEGLEVACLSTAKKGSAATEAAKLNFSYANGVLTVALGDELPKPGTYSFSCKGTLNGAPISGATLKVTVSNALPKVKLSASSVKLNRYLAGEEFAQLKATITGGDGFTLTGFKECDWLTVENGIVQVRLPEGATDGKVKYALTPVLFHEETGQELELAPLSLTVQTYYIEKLGATLSAKGKLDTQKPGSALVLTPKLSNGVGTVTGAELDAAYSTDFDVDVRNGLIYLTLKEDVAYVTNKSYSVKLKLQVNGEENGEVDGEEGWTVEAKPLSFKVTQTQPKATAATATVTLYQAQSKPAMGKLTLSAGEIGSVTVNAKTTAALRNSLAFSSTITGNTAQLTFALKNPYALTAGKSYTLYLDVSPKNNAANLKPIQVKLTVKVLK